MLHGRLIDDARCHAELIVSRAERVEHAAAAAVNSQTNGVDLVGDVVGEHTLNTHHATQADRASEYQYRAAQHRTKGDSQRMRRSVECSGI